MKRKAAAMLAGFLVMVMTGGSVLYAQSTQSDSVKVITLQEVQVVLVRAAAKTPVAYVNVGKEEINRQNFGQDIPFLLSSIPSVLTTSDAGTGVGYTSIRVRGTDASRINITANGIPMNDAESHNVYWVDMPDFASSLEDMQVQRGAGTSTNGVGAFGASINMRTQATPVKAYSELLGSYGSFNTHKETVKIGSGLLAEHWAFDLRLSNIQSNGYRDRASSDLQSYFIQGGYYGKASTFRFISFGGNEKTYHAWDGISREMLDTDRRYNPNGEIERNGEVAGFYEDQTDNYRQTHYQILCNRIFSPMWNLNVALHYTNGFGYYQEYKNSRTLAEYTLAPYEINGVAIKKANLVRQKLVGSDFGGAVFSLNYNDEKLYASLGGGANRYTNDHYGKVIWVENYIGTLDPSHEYYQSDGTKDDASIYAKANYEVGGGVNLYADLQYRHINYKVKGNNDKWDWTASPERLQTLNINESFGFFNPKAGAFWQINPNNSAYVSLSVAQKEPTRNNYTDGLFTQYPKPEKMFDYELGYTYRNACFTAGINIYYMDYTDQLVLNGKLNEIGEPMAENVKESNRTGIELSVGVKFADWLRWDVNGTWSQNRIKDYTEYLSNYDDSWNDLYTQTERHLGNTPIAFSPSFTGNSSMALNYKGWDASLQSQYVSRQYLDNSGSKENSLDAYFVNHLHVGTTFQLPAVKSITIGATIYNLLNEKYETNGYSMTAAIYKNGDKTNKPEISNDPRFYPMAGTNLLINVVLKF
ncbi:MAG: hypothetical protein EZS26_003244 [Candidatus Ordinivivax streblomastigis]|uniref:TonB-dependent receptor n=1 Tax=Candidatus Ordinivivax streblomastigis TaxID=2540710 RepID=A0A5M8NUM8_9BACT|nr:MAG: hypothetical protein EZS26_003244 [Candidatus Ordinivivax streblomastigis]